MWFSYRMPKARLRGHTDSHLIISSVLVKCFIAKHKNWEIAQGIICNYNLRNQIVRVNQAVGKKLSIIFVQIFYVMGEKSAN